MQEAAAAMLDMEEKLAQDDDGAYRKKVRDILDKHAGEVKRALDAGLPPNEFERAKKIEEAIQAASVTIDGVWARFHENT